jgi:signal transduction histidine kinase
VQQLNKQIQIIVEDNGNGFELQKNSTGFGLQGMQERVQSLAGQLKLITALGQGCRVMVSLPIE